jgi:hypothetical protein
MAKSNLEKHNFFIIDDQRGKHFVRISHFLRIGGYGLIVVHTEKLAPLSHIHTTLYPTKCIYTYRVPRCMYVKLGPPPPLPQASVPSPRNQRREGHLLAVEGAGGVPIPTTGEKA